MYKIIQKRLIFFIISGILISLGILSLIFWGLNFGIDFKGGSLITVKFLEQRPDTFEIKEKLSDMNLGEIIVQPTEESDVIIKTLHIDNNKYQEVLKNLKTNFGNIEEESFESIGPTIGKELREKAIIAIILVLAFIIIYITFAFRKVSSGPVKSWVYGMAAIVALIHDIIIVVGIFSIVGHFIYIEIGTLFVTALLTILGFSIHDTIVVFDRIRERLKISYTQSFKETVNDSVNQTLVRSLNTSFTTMLVLLALYLFGGESIKFFVLALIIGIIAGTYSSIFIASPLLVVWEKIRKLR